MQTPKVALVHDYLVQYGGAEKTLESIIELFPDAPIYTGIYSPTRLSEIINNQKVVSPNNSLINRFPKIFTFLMPIVFESFDLRDYDIIISDSSAWSKGVLTNPNQLHISYIHTPPRFLYKYTTETDVRKKWFLKPALALIDNWLRVWDYEAAQRPNYLIANSYETLKRIKKFYKRDARVIYPPVETKYNDIKVETNNLKKPFYLVAGRLAAYKNVDLVIQAFNLTGLDLEIVGTGKEEARLKKLANENIKFLGPISDLELHKKMAECIGFIFPVEDEEFGIVAIEAMSHGKPVLAHRSGGPLETIREGVDGMFFDKADVETFVSKLKEFDLQVKNGAFKSDIIKANTPQYSKDRFKKELWEFVQNSWAEKMMIK